MWSKEQQDKYNKEYYQRNKDKIKKQCNQYYHDNKEQCLETQKEYYNKNQKIIYKKSRAYISKNKEKCDKYQQEYKIQNKDKIASHKKKWMSKNTKTLKYRYGKAKSSAKFRKIEFLLSFDDYVKIISDANCHYCNSVIKTHGSSIDRKNNECYYSVENTVPCCRRCNVTFSNLYNYEEKLILAETIKKIDQNRQPSNNEGE